MKIVELLINELEDIMGFDAVALVHSPAHEANFHAFDTPDVEDAIAFQVIKQAFEELTNEGVSQEFGYYDDLPSKVLEKLLEKLGELGISKDSLLTDGYEVYDEPQTFGLPNITSAKPDETTYDVNGNYKILYEYKVAPGKGAPIQANTRDFCRRLIDLGLMFRKEDIQMLTITGANSEEFGYYNIMEFKGSYGCRHQWKKKYVYQKKKSNDSLAIAGLLLGDTNNREFNSEKYDFALDGEQQMVVGPLMIPDKLIFRVDENNEPYYCYFSKDTIKQIAQKMMKEKLLDRVNLEHDPDSPVSSFMVESWIIEDRLKDKQQAYGFDYPVGTWMGMYHIESPVHWEMVKQGKIKAYSIEGYFADKLIQK